MNSHLAHAARRVGVVILQVGSRTTRLRLVNSAHAWAPPQTASEHREVGPGTYILVNITPGEFDTC